MYSYYSCIQRKACQAKGLPLDDWRNVLDDRRPCLAPGTAGLVRQLGARAVLGLPKTALCESHI